MLKQVAALHKTLHAREEDLGLLPVGSSGDARSNRSTVLLAVTKLRQEAATSASQKESLETEKARLEGELIYA